MCYNLNMSLKTQLPYYSHYLSGSQLRLNWLKALTSNDHLAARRLDWHAHGELEIIIPLRGHYRYEFKGKTVSVDNESFIIIPDNTPHRLKEAIDPPSARLHLYLKNPNELSSIKGPFSRQEYTDIYQALSAQPLQSISATPILRSLLASLNRIVNRRETPLSDADRLQARFLCCLSLYHCATSKAATSTKSPSQTFAEAISWLKQNYASSVRLDDLITRIGYSRARFFDLFKQQTNMTPSEYLRNIRLKKAKELLRQTGHPVCQVGKICGLGDPAHFSRLFRKMTGYTPLAYRLQSCNDTRAS